MANKPGPKLEARLQGPVRARTYSVDDETHGFLVALGDGKASRGLRLAAWVAYVLDQRDQLPAEVTRSAHPPLKGRPG